MKTITAFLLTSPFALAFMALPAAGQDFYRLGESVAAGATSVAADSVAAAGTLERMRSDNRPEGPSLEFEHLWNASGGHNRWSAAVSQEILWPGAYSSAKELESATDRMLFRQSQAYRRQTAADAEAMIIALASGITRLEAQKRICANLDTLMAHYSKAFRAGEATIIDINKLRVENARAKVAMQQTIADNDALRAGIKALAPDAALPADAVLERLFALPLPATPVAEDGAVTAAKAARQAEAAQAEASLRHTRRSQLPTLSAGYVHAYEDATHFNGLSVGIGLPSYGSAAARRAGAAEALATKLRVIAADSEEEARRKSLTKRVESLKSALEQLEPAVRGVTAAGLNGNGSDSCPDSDVNVQMQLLQKALKGGQLSVIEFINESNYLIEAMMECIGLRAEILQGIAQLRPLTEAADAD